MDANLVRENYKLVRDFTFLYQSKRLIQRVIPLSHIPGRHKIRQLLKRIVIFFFAYCKDPVLPLRAIKAATLA